MEVISKLPSCLKEGHQYNPLNMICFDYNCKNDPLICPFCFAEFHFNHKNKVIKFLDFLVVFPDWVLKLQENKINENNCGSKYSDTMRILKKSREKCFQFYDDLEVLLIKKKKEIEKIKYDPINSFIEYKQTGNIKNINELIKHIDYENQTFSLKKNNVNIEDNNGYNIYLCNFQKIMTNIINYQEKALIKLEKNPLNFVNKESLLTIEIIDLLEECLQTNLYETSLELIFDGSTQGYVKKDFIESCYGRNNCFWLLKNEKNEIFGGFWQGSFLNYDKNEDFRIIIFSLEHKMLCNLSNNKIEINEDTTKYLFKIGKEFGIIENCDKNTGSFVNASLMKGVEIENESFIVIGLQVFEIMD